MKLSKRFLKFTAAGVFLLGASFAAYQSYLKYSNQTISLQNSVPLGLEGNVVRSEEEDKETVLTSSVASSPLRFKYDLFCLEDDHELLLSKIFDSRLQTYSYATLHVSPLKKYTCKAASSLVTLENVHFDFLLSDYTPQGTGVLQGSYPLDDFVSTQGVVTFILPYSENPGIFRLSGNIVDQTGNKIPRTLDFIVEKPTSEEPLLSNWPIIKESRRVSPSFSGNMLRGR